MIAKQQMVILDTIINENDVLRQLEHIGRNAYNSVNKNNDIEVTKKFIRKLLRLGHLGIFEHYQVTFKIVTNRAIANEIVRHRVGASYVQNSTRYIKYNSDIEFIMPFVNSLEEFKVWEKACRQSEHAYHELLMLGAKPELARDTLNLSTATTILTTMSLTAWMHFLELRLSKKAHPQIRAVAEDVEYLLQHHLPTIFGVAGELNEH